MRSMIPLAARHSSLDNYSKDGKTEAQGKSKQQMLGGEGTATFPPACGHSPFFLRGPQQVGPQDNGDVAGCHLVHLLRLGQQCQELHQVPGAWEGDLDQGQGILGHEHPWMPPET